MKSSIFDKDPIGSDRRRGILKSSNLLTNRQRPTPKNKSAQLQSTLQFVQAPSSITPTSASTSTSASSSSFQRQAQSSSPYPHSSKSFFSPKPSPSLTPTTNSNISNVNTNDNANVAASSLSISNLNSIPKFKKKSALPPTPPTQSHASGSVVAVSWSLDDMINSYNDSGHLPPPLSPTIPKLGSSSAAFGYDEADDADGDESEAGEAGEEDDDIPLSMLSPTLPPIFAKNIALPVPKRVSAVIETNNQFLGNNFNGKVKTIRKNVDTTSEKYIVQLSFSPEYRQKYGNLIKSKPPISEPVALPPLSHTSVSASITSSAPHFSLRAPTSPTTRPLAGLGISVKESTLEAGLQEYRSKLIQRKNHWIQLAKETSQKSSGTSNSKLSIVIRFDSIVLYMIAYDFEEKIKLVSDMLPLERYWSLLLKECKELIEVLKLEPLSELRDAFIGVLHSIRGVLLKRVNTILQKVINLYLQKKKETESYGENLSSKIIELQQQYISNCEQVVTEFQSNAKYDFSAILSQNFPKTFENRLRKMSTLPNKPKPDITGFVPSTDKYYLPIGVYSDLQEIAGLTYTCLKEYLEITKITYQLKCVG